MTESRLKRVNRNRNETESNTEQGLQFRLENRDFCPYAIALGLPLALIAAINYCN